MKIQLASDLHLEFMQGDSPPERLITPAAGADVLVLAGDIASGVHALKLFADWPVPILYVAGNHELYGHEMDPMLARLRQGALAKTDCPIHFLENSRVDIGGVRFLGTTLWTDYRLRRNHRQAAQMAAAQNSLNDHQLIRIGRGRFSTQDALARHQIARAWLAAELASPFAGQTVVISHHGPHPRSVHPRYEGDLVTAAFVSDLTDLLPGADLWLHGHVHDSFDYQVGACRVVANPAGYISNRWMARADFIFENVLFNPTLVLETSGTPDVAPSTLNPSSP